MTDSQPPQPPESKPPAGWYPNPEAPGLRYWDGTSWGPVAPPMSTGPTPAPYQVQPTALQPKSPTTAKWLHWLMPGAGHFYVGNVGGGIGFFIPSVILMLTYWVFFPLVIICEPIILIIAASTKRSMERSLAKANEAIARGQRPVFTE